MTEKRFLSFTFIEGIILTILGLCILILPKLTSMTFGIMLSGAFITYGVYKIIGAFVNKAVFKNLFFEIVLGALLTTIGILLLFVPNVSLLWLVALTGVYFILETVSITPKYVNLTKVFNYIGCKKLVALVLFIIGMIILLGIPSIAFWTFALLCGIAFLLKGVAKMTMFFINSNDINTSCCM